VQLPQAPGHPEFEAAYTAALEGREKPQPATVVRLPGQAAPKSLKAAWLILRQHDPEWQALGPDIKTAQTRIAERFLTTPLVEGEPLTYGEVALEHLKRKHVKALLAERSETPHAAAHLLRVIRKLIGVGLDQEWIEQIRPTGSNTGRPISAGKLGPMRCWTASRPTGRSAPRRAWSIRWRFISAPQIRRHKVRPATSRSHRRQRHAAEDRQGPDAADPPEPTPMCWRRSTICRSANSSR
jgi:hypothetical protein